MSLFGNGGKNPNKRATPPPKAPIPREPKIPEPGGHDADYYSPERQEPPPYRTDFKLDAGAFMGATMNKPIDNINKIERIAQDVRELTFKEMMELAGQFIKIDADNGKQIIPENSEFLIADILNKWAHSKESNGQDD